MSHWSAQAGIPLGQYGIPALGPFVDKAVFVIFGKKAELEGLRVFLFLLFC